jgi:penicillin-binding protein 1A
MRGVVQTGTGTAVRTEFALRGDLAGKTGTTQNNTDGWFMLMSPSLVAGAWVGFDDPRVTIRSNYWGQGGHNALRIVGSFMQEGQKENLMDAKAQFPQVQRDPDEQDKIEVEPEAPAAVDSAVAAPSPLAGLARLFGLPEAQAASAPITSSPTEPPGARVKPFAHVGGNGQL